MFFNSEVNIDENLWINILKDNELTTIKVLEILLFLMKQPKQESSGKDIAKALNYNSHATLNQIIPNFSKRILKKYTLIKKPEREDGTKRFWHIPFLGKKEKDKFIWIIRPELVTALNKLYDCEVDNYILPEEVTVNDILFKEGKVYEIKVNLYERDKKARKICLEKYGFLCKICGFNFEEKYGPIGKGKIHVHHIVPVSEYKKEYILNPEKDLIPVCPNCHLILHSKNEPFSIEELKQILDERKNEKKENTAHNKR